MLWRAWCVLVLAAGAAALAGFYRPLWDARLLGYRVDARFEPAAAQRARALYEREHGYRGAALVRALGAGRPPAHTQHHQVYGDVEVHYTYPGASSQPSE